MLPATYQIPATLVLLLSGVIACFFGHRLFRVVLALFGFIIGALAASSVVGSSSSTYMLVAAVAGGLAGAGVLTAAYFVGVALLGAALGAAVANLVFALFSREPGVLMLVLFSTGGAVLSMYVQRYVIIVGTAFGGAWTLIVGAMALDGNRTALAAAATGNVWVAYPLDPAPGQQWVPIAWMVIGLIGMGVQMGITGGEKGRVGRRKKK